MRSEEILRKVNDLRELRGFTSPVAIHVLLIGSRGHLPPKLVHRSSAEGHFTRSVLRGAGAGPAPGRP